MPGKPKMADETSFDFKEDIQIHPDDLAYLRTLQDQTFDDDDYEIASDCTIRGKVVGKVTTGINRFGVPVKRVVMHLVARDRTQMVFCWLHDDAIDVPIRPETWWQITGWPVPTTRRGPDGKVLTYIHLNVRYPQMIVPLTKRAKAYVAAWRAEKFGEDHVAVKTKQAPEAGSPAGDPGQVPRQGRSRNQKAGGEVPDGGTGSPAGPAADHRRPRKKG